MMCADWVRVVSVYLPLDDCRNFLALMGSRAIQPAQFRQLLFLGHKSRMRATHRALSAISICAAIPCSSDVSGSHLCFMTRVCCGRNIDVVHQSYEKLSRISFVYRCGTSPPSTLPDYSGTFELLEDTRLRRSTSNSYQVVELTIARDNVLEIISVLLPSEMLDFSPTRANKIKPDWRTFVV